MLKNSFYEAERSWTTSWRERAWMERNFCILRNSILTLGTKNQAPSKAVTSEIAAVLTEKTTVLSDTLATVQQASSDLQARISKQYEPSVQVPVKRYIPSSPIAIADWAHDSGRNVYVIGLSSPFESSYSLKQTDALVFGRDAFLFVSLTPAPPTLTVSGHKKPTTGSILTAVYIDALLPNSRLIEITGDFQPAVDGIPSVVPFFLQLIDKKSETEPRVSIVNQVVKIRSGDGIKLIPQVGNDIDQQEEFFIESEQDYFVTASLINNKNGSYYSTL